MRQDFARFGAHPPGEQSAVEPDASGRGVVVDSFAGSVRVEFDHEAAFTPLGQLPFFIEFSEDRGAVRGVRGGLPAALHQPERAQEARRAGDGDVVDVGRAQALRAYRSAARRRRVARASRHEQDRQRGRGSAGVRGDRGRSGRERTGCESSRPLRGAAFEQAVDPRRRYAGEAALRPSGRSGGRLQSQEAWAAQPLLSHLFDGGDAIGSRGGCERGRRAYFPSQRAWPVGVVGSHAARWLAFSFARRQGLRQ